MRPKMTRTRLVHAAVCLAALGLAGSSAFSDSGPAEVGSAAGRSLTELLQERRAVLKALVEVQVQAYRIGKLGFEPIVQAHKELLAAELELASDRAERVELIQKFVHLAADFEKLAAEKLRAGEATQADVLRAQALRLEAQVMAARARGKSQDGGRNERQATTHPK